MSRSRRADVAGGAVAGGPVAPTPVSVRGLALTQLISSAIYLLALGAVIVIVWITTGRLHVPGSRGDDGSADQHWAAGIGGASLPLFLVFLFGPIVVGTVGGVGLLRLATSPMAVRSRWTLAGATLLAVVVFLLGLRMGRPLILGWD